MKSILFCVFIGIKFVFSKETRTYVTCHETPGKNKSVLVLVKPSFDVVWVKARERGRQGLCPVVLQGSHGPPHLCSAQLSNRWAGQPARAKFPLHQKWQERKLRGTKEGKKEGSEGGEGQTGYSGKGEDDSHGDTTYSWGGRTEGSANKQGSRGLAKTANLHFRKHRTLDNLQVYYCSV